MWHLTLQNYVVDAQFLWNKMKDLKCTNVKMSHDGYLKLYQLSHPKLKNFDCILIDEAQDLTPGTYTCILVVNPRRMSVSDANMAT